MRTTRCKCGNSTSFGSMPSPNCVVCPDCGSTQSGHPDHHPEPEPHDPVTRYDQNTGEPFVMCSRCMERLPADYEGVPA